MYNSVFEEASCFKASELSIKSIIGEDLFYELDNFHLACVV